MVCARTFWCEIYDGNLRKNIFSTKEILSNTIMQCNRLSQKTDLEIKEELKKVDNLFLLHPETCFAFVSCCLLYEFRGNQATMRGRGDINAQTAAQS